MKHSTSPLLRTLRTTIRPYAEEDVERILPILSDPITMSFWPQPFSREQVETWVRRGMETYDQIGLGRMIVELPEHREVIGDCGIMLTEVNGRTEYDLGYIIHHPYWRHGFAVECAEAMLKYGLGKGVRRIVANMAHDHPGSKRVAEKLGMKKEAEFINARNRGIRTLLYVLQINASHYVNLES